MKLFDRYLEAVKKHLPWQGQDDILAELRANLESQAEEREAELGRPMTEAEMEAWLRELGSPLEMAARYRPQQYLIGPALFPTYWYVLRMVLMWALGIYVLISAVMIAFSTPSPAAAGAALLRAPWVLFITAAWVTIAFAILERAAVRNPGLLAKASVGIDDWKTDVKRNTSFTGGQTSRTTIVAEVVFRVLLLGWLLLIPEYPQLMFGPGMHMVMALPYKFAPVIMQFYWWIVALNALQLALPAVALARGNWEQTQAARKLAVAAMALIPLGWLLTAARHEFFLLKHPALATAAQAGQLATVNHILYQVIWLLWILKLAQFLWQAGKTATEEWHRRAAAQQG